MKHIKILLCMFLFFLMAECASATVYIYPITAISDTKILPASDMSGYSQSDTITIRASPGEITCGSFVLNSDSQINNLNISVSDLNNSHHTISASYIDLAWVKCWWQGGIGITNYNVQGKYLTPELLLHNDSIISVTNDTSVNSPASQSSNGKNYVILSNGVSVDVTNSTQVEGEPNLIPISNMPIKDDSTLQSINLSANYNKQVWIKTLIPDNSTSGLYTGTLTLKNGQSVLKTITLNVIIYPIDLLPPTQEFSMYYTGFINGDGSISSLDKTTQQFTAEMIDMVNHGVFDPTIESWIDDDTLCQELNIRQSAGMNNSNFYRMNLLGSLVDADYIHYYKNLTATYGVEDWYEHGPDETNLNTTEQRNQMSVVHGAGGKYYNSQALGYEDDPTSVADVLDLAISYGALSPGLAELYHSYGHRVFSYSNPQTVSEYPLTFRINYGLALWQNDYDGAMPYVYQGGPGNIWNDFDNTYRDHVMAYPTSDGVIDTVQWEGFREGVNDLRYLATLQEAINSYPSCSTYPSCTTYNTAQEYITTLKNSNLSTFNLDTTRMQIANHTVALKSNEKKI